MAGVIQMAILTIKIIKQITPGIYNFVIRYKRMVKIEINYIQCAKTLVSTAYDKHHIS